MLLFIPRSLCALKRVAAKAEHARFGATQGIRIAMKLGLYRAEATDGHRAIIVQGLAPKEEPPWPGFKELPNDAFEAIILPKDLERACKVGEDFLQSRFRMVGIATVGNGVCLGLGSELVTAQNVEGRFPQMDKIIPKKRPLFTFRVDPKILAETLLAMADLLPDTDRGVQFFYYGGCLPLGFCARNPETGMMIDALVVPLVPCSRNPKDKPVEDKDGKDAQPNEAAPPPEPPPPTDQDAKPEEAPVNGRKKAKSKN